MQHIEVLPLEHVGHIGHVLRYILVRGDDMDAPAASLNFLGRHGVGVGVADEVDLDLLRVEVEKILHGKRLLAARIHLAFNEGHFNGTYFTHSYALAFLRKYSVAQETTYSKSSSDIP